MSIVDPYQLGYAAYGRAVDHCRNPYDAISQATQRRNWLKGWRAARKDAMSCKTKTS